LQEYYEQHKQHVVLENGQTVTISAQGRQEPMPKQQHVDEYGQEEEQQQPTEVEEFSYYDPVQKIRFSFHPITLEAKIEQEGYDIAAEQFSQDIISLR
jgi:hypothetical protein